MYSTTKAALIMMTRCYALELGPAGVRVNFIAPGLIRTVLSEYYWKDEARLRDRLTSQPITFGTAGGDRRNHRHAGVILRRI